MENGHHLLHTSCIISTGTRPSCNFPCLFHNNFKTRIIMKQTTTKVQLGRLPVLACSPVIISSIFIASFKWAITVEYFSVISDYKLTEKCHRECGYAIPKGKNFKFKLFFVTWLSFNAELDNSSTETQSIIFSPKCYTYILLLISRDQQSLRVLSGSNFFRYWITSEIWLTYAN